MMSCYVKVYGCQMNAADSALISRILSSSGIEEVSHPDQAEWVVVLTCAVRQHAEDRAAGFARTMRGQGRKVIIAGCMGRLRREKLIEQGIADRVLTPDQYRLIPRILGARRSPSEDPESLETYSDILPSRNGGGVSASVSIMRGCNNYCSYCVVPHARGQERSIPYPAIEGKVRYLVEEGASQIFLLGQNVLAYEYQDMGFVEVLEGLSGIRGLKRIGFLTSHPRDLTHEHLCRMAEIPQLLGFFHLPLQSGSDRILHAMRRGYTVSEYREKLEWIRELFPRAYVSTDLMVGFPGEEDGDFRLTLDCVRDMKFDFAYMFAYSSRPGTPAARMGNQIPEDERKRRLAVLIECQNRITAQATEAWVGRTEEVFVSAPAARPEGAVRASLSNNRSVILENPHRLGHTLRCRLVGVSGRSVLAEPTSKEA